jgi:hypothetical protein
MCQYHKVFILFWPFLAFMKLHLKILKVVTRLFLQDSFLNDRNESSDIIFA